MKTGKIYPQLSPMKADVFLKFFIRANLRHLRLNNSLAQETDKAVKEILEKIGV